MIEIIKEHVEMPKMVDRRYQSLAKNPSTWEVIDTHKENSVRFKGSFESVSLACYNLNKKFYLNA